MLDDQLHSGSTLTDWEWFGLHQKYNLADGHAHYRLPLAFAEVLSQLPTALLNIEDRNQAAYEKEFLEALFLMAGQSLPPFRPSLHYASSVSIEMSGKVLAATNNNRVGVLSPTFDNIPLLLLRSGITLVPIREAEIDEAGGLPPSILDACDAVFLVLPNNPTGWLPSRAVIGGIANQLATADKILVIDFSFRFYSDLHTWDQYALVNSITRRCPQFGWILLEDTGKTWSTGELKAGIASCSKELRPHMQQATGELLLNTSPLMLNLLTGLIAVELQGTLGAGTRRSLYAQRVVDTNRAKLRTALVGTSLEVASLGSSISIEWLRLPDGYPALEICKLLADDGVAVLPGGPFYWDDRSIGDSYMRVALAREPTMFAEAADALGAGLRRILPPR